MWGFDQTDQVVDDVGEGPDERHGEEGNAEQDDVQHDGQQQVGEPYPSAVHHPRVGVHLAVSYAHIHLQRGQHAIPFILLLTV